MEHIRVISKEINGKKVKENKSCTTDVAHLNVHAMCMFGKNHPNLEHRSKSVFITNTILKAAAQEVNEKCLRMHPC